MPNTKAAIKAMRTSRRKRAINRRVKDKVKNEVRAVQDLIAADKKKEAQAKLKDVYSALDKAVKKNVMKKNTASRKKSRLTKAVEKIGE